MDSDAQERTIRFLGSIAFAGMLMLFAYLVKESLPYVTAALGVVVGNVTGAEIATRTAKQTRKKVAEESERPPPNDDDGGGTTVVSEPPPLAMPRRDTRNRRFLVPVGVVVLALVAVACAGSSPPNPVAAIYGVEGLNCVDRADSAAAARACIREVDERYGQDGGLSNDR